MKQSDRDLDLIERILEDASVLNQRLIYFSLTQDSFSNDHSFEGEIAYDSVMNPLYRIVEDSIHLSDELMDAYPELPWKNIKGFRNFVAHGYSSVNRELAWKIIDEDLPVLIDALERYAEKAS